MSKSVAWLEESVDGESKENIVLESRVEILIVDEGEESDEGGWDGVWDEEDEGVDIQDGGWGRGRMAMSLPRREY